MSREQVLAERLVRSGSGRMKSKLVFVRKGADTARLHGRDYRRTTRVTHFGFVVFEPVDPGTTASRNHKEEQ